MIGKFSGTLAFLLPNGLRAQVFLGLLPSVGMIAAELVISEYSPAFRRWMPTRPEQKVF
jgi:hypothetical protein